MIEYERVMLNENGEKFTTLSNTILIWPLRKIALSEIKKEDIYNEYKILSSQKLP